MATAVLQRGFVPRDWPRGFHEHYDACGVCERKIRHIHEDEELVPDHWDSVSRIASFVQSRLGLVEASQQNVADGA